MTQGLDTSRWVNRTNQPACGQRFTSYSELLAIDCAHATALLCYNDNLVHGLCGHDQLHACAHLWRVAKSVYEDHAWVTLNLAGPFKN